MVRVDFVVKLSVKRVVDYFSGGKLESREK